MSALLEVERLGKQFAVRGAVVRAVQDVSFAVAPGEVLGLVGESGSGKTTLGRLVLRLIKPNAGTIRFRGEDLLLMGPSRLRAARRHMQIIFQDPFSSLNPTATAGAMVGEGLDIHRLASGRARAARVAELLDQVGLPADAAGRYAHEFSGGQRQRIGIARALSVSPSFVVADEPVSALDVSVQAQVVNLLQDLQARLGLAMLFISHDLAVVEHIADRVMVMYMGRVMEVAPRRALYAAPRHPYTVALMSAVPVPDPLVRRDPLVLQGDIPSPLDPPSGCVFRTRCPAVLPACAEVVPPLREVGAGHLAACIRDDIG